MSINTLNTRDLESRRQELEDELEGLISNIPDDINDEDYLDAAETLAYWLGVSEHDHLEFIGRQAWDQGHEHLLERWASGDADAQALKDLNDLRDSVQDWRSGVTLIDETDFEEYAWEYANDIGATRQDLSGWPYDHIDWSAAARELARDYETCEFEGTTYLYRA